jgi:hypothetical protein
LAALGLVALISLISAGCGSNAPSETGTASSTGTGGNKNATGQDKAVKFAECMHNNGVSDFPDPNAKGEFVYGVSVSPAVFKKAVDACKDLQPPGALSAKRSPKQQTASLKFAQWIRDNGVKDFPDPANGEPLVDTRRIPSTERNGGMSILNAAMQKCRSVMDKAAAGQ